ncbi:hypothetical protein EV356DRAFT_530764 [Viridothelium virens]|uniref:Rhodopsin domain-containing protein n=1 Tax=Viridothelium virens TaxID=1048519 RepID=A0A6A6HFK9_VIRVR|nr:hypothetical protein EV356DRAFT_530764 [Viridothelium virens]
MTSTAPPEDEQPTSTIAISGLVIALAILFVALRFYIRISTKAGLGWDDFLLLAAVASTILTAVLVLWASAVNPHGNWVAEAIDPSYQFVAIDVFYSKLTFVASVLYFTIAGSTKLSILFMYNRIFSVNRQFRIQLYLASFMVLGWWVGCTVATLTNCIPLRYSWINALADPRYCFNFNIYWMAAGAVEVVIDIVILSLPVRVVLGLQLSRRNKATVAMIFLLGGFVVVTGIIRTILGYHRGHYREPLYSPVEVWTMLLQSQG